MASPLLSFRACEQARRTRDRRFDGLLFIAVRSTGIYCRPICPAPAAKSRNVEYYTNAAAAAAAGYRPCLRCRPEAAPGTPLNGSSALVGGALRLIERGLLDREGVGALAARVGVGERHLRRLFEAELGAGPLQIAATRRLLFAKKLLAETQLSVTEIALASGYASVRRFNSAVRASYGQPPRALRRAPPPRAGAALTLRLPYRAPHDFAALLGFFARRAIPGIEQIDADSYVRHFAYDGNAGSLRVRHAGADDALLLEVAFADSSRLQEIASRVRRMFDLDADVATINTHLRTDPRLRPLVRRHPGQRLPGGWDGFEVAVRAVLGQQVSVAAARTLAQRLVQRFGSEATLADGREIRLFPVPEILADADLTAEISITRQRAATLRAVARAICDGHVDFRPEQTLEAFAASWTQLPGIGAWTAHYIAMRALGDPDAFPAADLVLRKALAQGRETLAPVRAVEAAAEAWRPWRAYALMHLWRNA